MRSNPATGPSSGQSVFHRAYRVGFLLLFFVWTPTSTADLISLTYPSPDQLAEFEEQISPLKLQAYRTGPSATAVVEQWPDRPGRGTGQYQVVFYDLASGMVTDPVIIAIDAPVSVVNEPDTIRDLFVMFGMPPPGTRIGGRRHTQMVMDAILTGDAESAGLLYEGAGLRWLLAKAHSDEALETFEGHGGTWSEYGHFGNFDIALSQLVWTIALNRRQQLLETGFDRAAIALLRAWIQANLIWLDSQTEESDRSYRARSVTDLDQGVWAAVPGAGYVYDPPDVRAAYKSLIGTNKPAEVKQYEGELAAAIAGYPEGRPEGRINLGDPQSAVDPSDTAEVKIDLLRALDLTEPAIYRKLGDTPTGIVQYCAPAFVPDPRSLDRVDLLENIEQLLAELFDAAIDSNTDYLEAISASLWDGVLSRTTKSTERAECEINLMSSAYWGSAASMIKGAEGLMRAMTVNYPGQLFAKETQENWETLDANVLIAVAMRRATDGPFGSPSTAMSDRMTAFVKETAKIRADILVMQMTAEEKTKALDSIAWREDLAGRWGMSNPEIQP